MYQKLSLVTIGILLFGIFITSALGSINGGWVTTLVKSGTNSGSLGFWSPDTPQASTPQMTLTQSGLEVNGKFKLADGTQGSGKLLMSDANGFASWKSTNTNKCGSFIYGSFSLGSGSIVQGGDQWSLARCRQSCEANPAIRICYFRVGPSGDPSQFGSACYMYTSGSPSGSINYITPDIMVAYCANEGS